MGWREFGSITILSRMVSNEGVRGFLNSLRTKETPLGSSTSVKHPKGKGKDNSSWRRKQGNGKQERSPNEKTMFELLG
jgi:hypothetical protein